MTGSLRHAAAAGLLASVPLLAGVAPMPASAQAGRVQVKATIDGAPIGSSTETRPIRLSPHDEAMLAVDVTNGTGRPLDIRTIRLEGKVLGLTFFAYDTAVGLEVAPGATGSRRFLLDLGGLDGQATGLIPGGVKLLDRDRRVVGEEGAVFDVRGSLRSVYGVFGVSIAFLTVLSFLGALIGLARHRLPPNRWRRGLRFLTPGLGLGLLLNFTLSATRVFVPTPGRWLTIVVVSAAVLFGLGYLTPAPDAGDDDEDLDELEAVDELVALPAPAVAPELPAPPARPELAAPDVAAALPAPAAPPAAETVAVLDAAAEPVAPPVEPEPHAEGAPVAVPAPPTVAVPPAPRVGPAPSEGV